MNPLFTSWLFFPSSRVVPFSPTADHAMHRLLLGSGFAEWKSMQTLQPDFPSDVPPPSSPMRPVKTIPTDVPVPEPFDVPVPDPMDVPPPDPRDVPPPKQRPDKDPIKDNWAFCDWSAVRSPGKGTWDGHGRTLLRDCHWLPATTVSPAVPIGSLLI